MSQTILSLPVGSIVKSLNTKYNNSVIRFIVGHHTGGRTKLVTERIISLKCVDAREVNGGDINIRSYGNNRYSLSNIDQWLNKSTLPWYVASYSADAPPDAANVRDGYNPYSNEVGFLANIEPNLLAEILDSTIRVAKNTTRDGGGYEDIVRKVYLLSNTEVGLAKENKITEGTLWSYFSTAANRQTYPTPEAVSTSDYTDTALASTKKWKWWLRTPSTEYSHFSRYVAADGTLGETAVNNSTYGLRPAFEVASTVPVSDAPDTDGAYIIQLNQPPTQPTTISHGTPQAGQPLVLTTGGSTDPEGDAISYVWERRVDGGTYAQIGITTAKTITDTVPSSGTNYQVRVKAADASGESAYREGTATPINYNTPPVISGTDQNVGAKTDPFTYQYTVTDAQQASISVTEVLSNGSLNITLRSYTATSGAQNTADLSPAWLRLIPGTHTLTITASDGAGGTAQRIITFSRTVSRLAGSRAIATDAPVTKCFLSIYPSDRPTDAVLHCEVTNNPFDASPVWEDITTKVNKFVHNFANTTIGTNGIAYRFYITKGTQQIEVIQVTERFA